MKNFATNRESGVALVVTLIVLAVMAVVAVAFMQGAGTDRSAANSLVASYQARLAAEAGAQCVATRLTRVLSFGGAATNTPNPSLPAGARGYHDAVTVWQNIGGSQTNEATVLYVRAASTNTDYGARPEEFGAAVRIMAQPLVSGGTLVPVEQIGTNMPFKTNDATMVNLNATNQFVPDPWIGYRSSGNVGAPVMAARWIYISRDGGPTNATNPPIARYAFWAEDESFKANLNVLTNDPRGTNAGTGPEQATIDGPLSASSLLSSLVSRTTGMLKAREDFGGGGFASTGAGALALGLQGTTNAAAFRFLTTVHSAGLDLSRGGFKRFNINTVTNGIPGPTSTNEIRTNLSRIIAAITNSNSVPNFGQRFYRLNDNAAGVNATGAVTSAHADIYLQKIAANSLDYIDTDSQPTVVNNDETFSVRAVRPAEVVLPLGDGLQGTNSVAAYGVENIPYLYGYGVHARLRSMSPIGFNSTNNPPPVSQRVASFEFTVDHYLEFWNMGTRPIEFGSGNAPGVDYIPNAFLKIANSPGWGTSQTTGEPVLDGFNRGDRDYETEIPDGTRIEPGASVLFTTAPEEDAKNVAPNATRIVSLSWPVEKREFSGETRYVVTATNTALNFDRLYAIRRVHSTRQGNALDAETEILLGNEMGLLQSFPYATVNTRNLMVTNNSVLDSDSMFIDRSRLRGNRPGRNSNAPTPYNPRSQEGDPRTLNEQLMLLDYKIGSGADQSRFFTDNENTIIGRPNTDWVQSEVWVDPSSMLEGAANAPMITANQSMRSIGELGHVVDPARPLGVDPADALHSRGGGRTLRIGQPEHPRWFDGNQTNASRTWTSWRLADVFTTKAALSTPGLINPNGVLRDGGAAFRAALQGLTFLPSPEGAPGLAGLQLNAQRLNVVVTNLASYLTNATAAGLPTGALNPLWERGEISQLPIFNTSIGPLSMSDKFDRGREELVRRSIEMITTRGSVFTIYAIGQALQATATATNVTGVFRLRKTIEIVPQFQFTGAGPSGLPEYMDDAFNPTQPARINRRFSPPTSYTYRVISVSYD